MSNPLSPNAQAAVARIIEQADEAGPIESATPAYVAPLAVALQECAEPYIIAWWSAEGAGDDATFHQAEYTALDEAELAFECVRVDLANDFIGRNWSSPISLEGDYTDIPF
jgi:hypothetical protein